jgi:S-adenosylmethionine hydrolase
MSIVALTTDYGTQDYYVGAIKGAILGIAPNARIVDVTHEIRPHDVLHGAFVVRQVWPWYPKGTIHLVIVDPGVGSQRRIILGQYGGRYIVAPDNGLVTLLHRDFPAEAMHVVEDRRYFLPVLSATFQGRDMMAPVAAHLANGVNPRRFGRVTDRLEMLPVAHRAAAIGGIIRGGVLHVDRFGTIVTNVLKEQVCGASGQAGDWEVLINGTSVGPVRATFSDVELGEPVAFIGSCGMLEIAVNRGSAIGRFGPAESVRVEVRGDLPSE